MSVYFELYAYGQKEPAKFTDVDKAMCAHFGVEPDEVKFYCMWYDIIGRSLACGTSYAELRKRFVEWQTKDSYDPELRERYGQLIKIVEWMNENYVPQCWGGWGR